MQSAVDEGHGAVGQAVEVLVHELLRKHFKVDVAAEHVVDLRWKIFYGYVGSGSVGTQHVGHVVHLFDNRRHEQIKQQPCEQCGLGEGDENSDNAPLQPQKRAVILHERLEQIGYKACHQEGEEHIFQHIDEPDGRRCDGHRNEQAHHAVESIGL